MELFQLADYVMAPKKIIRALAEDAKIVIAERITQLNALASLNKEQAEELYNLRVAQQARENGKFDINGLVRKIDKKPTNVRPLCNGPRTLDLSYESTKGISENKLQSLNGIEKLATDYRITHTIKFDNQDIEKVNLGRLKKPFPELYTVSLKNNQIESIVQTEAIRLLEVDLTANPLKSITIKRPERCNYLKFKTDKPGVKVEFVQNTYSKTLTWLKSLAAKSKLWQNTYLVPMGDIPAFGLFMAVATTIIGAGVLVIKAELNEWRIERGLKQLVLANDSQRIPLEEFKGQTLSSLVEKYGQNTHISTLIQKTDSLPFTGKEKLHELLASGISGFKITSFLIASYWMGNFLHNTLWKEKSDYSLDLQTRAKMSPYRIRVEAGNNIVKGFPSNYNYKLFDKN